MIVFARFAYFTIARDAGFVSLAAALLMLAFSFELPMAFEAGATVALIFSVGLLIRVCCLTEQRFTRSEAWSTLQDEERPAGEDGMRWARAELERMLLRFAKSAAGIAGILYGSALVLSVA
jgi:hypothetical protein